MYLTEIVATILEAINDSDPSNWPIGAVLPTDLPVSAALDPFSTKKADKGVYIIPGYNEFNLANARGPKDRKLPGLQRIKRITLATYVPFQSLLDVNKSKDVTDKSEWSLISNLVEDLETFVLTTNLDGLKLVDIESAPPEESFLDSRVYLVATVLGFSEKC